MPTIFSSYKRTRITEVMRLIEYLQARGLKTWQDVSDLGAGTQIEDELRRAVSVESDGFVLYFSEDVGESPHICNIEVKEALKAHGQNPGYLFIPVFEGVTFKEAAFITHSLLGTDLTTFNGKLVPRLTDSNDQEFDDALREIAHSAVRSCAREFGKSVQPSETPVKIHLESYQAPGPDMQSDFDVDIRHVLERRGIGDQRLWMDFIMPGLDDLRHALADYVPTREIEVWSKALISLGIAFGYVFHRPTGFRLKLHQEGDIWASDAAPDKDTGFIVDCQSGNVGSDYASIELSIAWDVCQGVTDYAKANQLSFRARCSISPKGGTSRYAVSSDSQAVGIADQVLRAIDQLRNERNVRTIHLFASIPINLAIILGHYLNACGPIQIYDWDKANRSYLPTCHLVEGP